jgi:hypothetical protein
MMAAIRRQANTSAPPKSSLPIDAQEPVLIRWSVQEIRRVASRLARRQIRPAAVIAWSLWRRAHQVAAQE